MGSRGLRAAGRCRPRARRNDSLRTSGAIRTAATSTIIEAAEARITAPAGHLNMARLGGGENHEPGVGVAPDDRSGPGSVKDAADVPDASFNCHAERFAGGSSE